MSAAPKGVVMLTANYHPYIGGAEGKARSVAQARAARDIPVRVVTRALAGLAAEEDIDGVPVLRLAAWGAGPAGAAIFAVASFLYLARRRADYDVVHVHLASSPALAAALAGRLFGKRVLVKLGGGKGVGEVALSRKTALGRLKLKALGALRPTLAAVNGDILAELAGSGLEDLPAFVVPNGVDLGRFAPAANEQKRELRRRLDWPEGFALLSASRLTQDKGVGDLLREFLGVWAAAAPGKSARLYIAGTGPEEASLRALALRTGLEKSVVFLGARRDLDALYRAADAFLLPTASEGLSNSLLEAMACALPVLATRVSGTKDVMVQDGENGLLYEPGRPEEIKKQLERLLGEPDLAARLGRAARATAERFSLDRTVERWLELYGEPPAP